MNIKELKKYIALTGGATLDAYTGSVALLHNGYMVSVKGYERKLRLSNLNNRLLGRYVKIAKQQNAFIGLWLDEGVLYIDISVCISDLHEAIITATANEQLAIYDLKNAVSIYLK